MLLRRLAIKRASGLRLASTAPAAPPAAASSTASSAASTAASSASVSAASASKAKSKSGGPAALPVIAVWNAVRRLPFGSALFALLIRYVAPYSATVSPRVRELRPGYCRIDITERFMLTNPFNSIHALALMNVGELTSGLVLTSTFQKQGLRGIVTKLDAEYFKKAKGTVTAVAVVDQNVPLLPADAAEGTTRVVTEIFNKDEELLCRTTAYWNIKRA